MSIARAVGNLAMQAKLRAGATNDPLEREADEVASCSGCAASAPCASCSGGEKRIRGVGAGAPLDDVTRARMESRLAYDFSRVRVHDNAEASRAAAGIRARAFTIGSDIVFAEGEHQPATQEGQSLLAHELTHVVQQSSSTPVVQRAPEGEGEEESLDDPCAVDVPSLSNQSLVDSFLRAESFLANHEKGQPWYDWANLMRRIATERRTRVGMGHTWLGDISGGMPAILHELRASEDFMVEVVPADVDAESGEPFDHGGTTFVVTAAQFEHFLQIHNMPSMDPDAFFEERLAETETPEPLSLLLPPPEPEPSLDLLPLLQPYGMEGVSPFIDPFGTSDVDLLAPAWGSSAVAGGQLYVSPYEYAAQPYISSQVYSQNVNMANPRSVSGAETNWRGALPEMGTARGSWTDYLRYQDLNLLMPSGQRNFPRFDFRDPLTGDLISVTHTLQTGTQAMAVYDTKFFDMIGTEVTSSGVIRMTPQMTQAITRLNQNFGGNVTILDVAGHAYLTVNEDHVDTYKQHLRTEVTTHPERYANLVDAYLRATPLQAGGTSIATWNDLQAARSAGTISQAEFTTFVSEFADSATTHVISNNLTTRALNATLQHRINTQNLTPEQYRSQVPLELQESISVGTPQAIHRSGVRGAKAGAGMSLVIEGGQILFTDRELDWRYPTNVALGAGGGYIASSIESSVVIATAEPLVGSTSALAGLGRFGGRIGGATLGGAVAAPVVTTAAMGLEELFTDVDYTYIDYTARGTRALVSGAAAAGGGAAAGAGTAALVGAAGGSWGGPAGWVVGAGVGLLIYYVVDDAVGEDIEEDIRESLGEQGCVPEPEYEEESYDAYEGMSDVPWW